jgi:hypothetical protein
LILFEKPLQNRRGGPTLIFQIHYATLEKIGFLEKKEKKENGKKQVFFLFSVYIRMVPALLRADLTTNCVADCCIRATVLGGRVEAGLTDMMSETKIKFFNEHHEMRGRLKSSHRRRLQARDTVCSDSRRHWRGRQRRSARLSPRTACCRRRPVVARFEIADFGRKGVMRCVPVKTQKKGSCAVHRTNEINSKILIFRSLSEHEPMIFLK